MLLLLKPSAYVDRFGHHLPSEPRRSGIRTEQHTSGEFVVALLRPDMLRCGMNVPEATLKGLLSNNALPPAALNSRSTACADVSAALAAASRATARCRSVGVLPLDTSFHISSTDCKRKARPESSNALGASDSDLRHRLVAQAHG